MFCYSWWKLKHYILDIIKSVFIEDKKVPIYSWLADVDTLTPRTSLLCIMGKWEDSYTGPPAFHICLTITFSLYIYIYIYIYIVCKFLSI